MAERYNFVGNVRGRGVLLGIEPVEDRASKKPADEMTREAVRRCEERGLLVQARSSHSRSNVIRLVPPMVCTDVMMKSDKGLAILEDVFAGLAHDGVGRRRVAAPQSL